MAKFRRGGLVKDVGGGVAVLLQELDEDRLVEPVAARMQKERVGATGPCRELIPHSVSEGNGGFGEAYKKDGPG